MITESTKQVLTLMTSLDTTTVIRKALQMVFKYSDEGKHR